MIWRWFWREWRSPSLLIVWLALTLSVACVLALGSISDRMDKGSASKAATLSPAIGCCAVRIRCRKAGCWTRSSRG